MPVIVIQKLEQAVPLTKALMAGGIRVLEITLRTRVAVEAVRAIHRDVPGAMVGVGTVTHPEELTVVAEAGAVFAISPGLTVELLQAANQGPIPLIPGISTVSELMTGMALGYTHFKFFPAEAAGGVKMLKSIAGPFPRSPFVPRAASVPITSGTICPWQCCLCRRLMARSARIDGPRGLGTDYRSHAGSGSGIGAFGKIGMGLFKSSS